MTPPSPCGYDASWGPCSHGHLAAASRPVRSGSPCSRETGNRLAHHRQRHALPVLLVRSVPSTVRRAIEMTHQRSGSGPGEAAFGREPGLTPARSARHFPSGEAASLQSDRAFALSHRNETARIPKGSIAPRPADRSPPLPRFRRAAPVDPVFPPPILSEEHPAAVMPVQRHATPAVPDAVQQIPVTVFAARAADLRRNDRLPPRTPGIAASLPWKLGLAVRISAARRQWHRLTALTFR